MECGVAKNLLSQYLEDDLEAETKKTLQAHLATCISCARELQELRNLIMDLKKIPEVEPPADFLEAVQSRIEESSFLRKVLKKLFVPVYLKIPLEAVAVTATAVIIVILVSKRQIPIEMTLVKQIPTQALDSERKPAPKIETGALEKVSGVEKELLVETQMAKAPEVSPMMSPRADTEYGPSFPPPEIPPQRIEIVKRETISPESTSWAGKMAKETQAAFAPDSSGPALYPPFVKSKEIVLKSENLPQDKLEIDSVLRDLGISDIKQEEHAQTIIFTFSLPADQLQVLVRRLKSWEAISLPAARLVGSQPVRIKLTLTSKN